MEARTLDRPERSVALVPIERVETAAYTIPTDVPESDGTLEWDRTTLVTVEVEASGARGFGYTYADASAAWLIRNTLADRIRGEDAMDTPAAWSAMVRSVRNIGRQGIAATAIAAVDIALWDLKAALLGVPLDRLLGSDRDEVPVYGSGGFLTDSIPRLQEQLAGWASQGIARVKMKVGRDPNEDLVRVRCAREAIGDGVELFVDANGGYIRKQALRQAESFADLGVSWFEEPVSSDDLEGLRLLRDRAPAGMDIAAGEYGFDVFHFRSLLERGAVDVLQADATRCAGITGFLRAGALGDAHNVPLSAHTAPSLHVAPCCALAPVRHVEYFHDHVRIEQRFLEGAPLPAGGCLRPDRTRPGLGLTPRHADLEPYRVL